MVGDRVVALATVVLCGCGRIGFDSEPGCAAKSCAAIDAGSGVDGPHVPDGSLAGIAGTYGISGAITYTCALGLVDINVTTFTLATGSKLTVTSDDPGAPQQPCAMTGSPPSGNNFSATCLLPGGCNETYTLTGAFTDADHWTGALTATYVGQCADCVTQDFPVMATRM